MVLSSDVRQAARFTSKSPPICEFAPSPCALRPFEPIRRRTPRFAFPRAAVAACLGLLACLALPIAARGQAIDPDSPAVKTAIEKGLTYLETTDPQGHGQKSLVGLTYTKAGKPADDVKISGAAKGLRDYCSKGVDAINISVYETATAIMFLVALDPQEYRSEIETLVQAMRKKQKPAGAWGYPEGHQHGATCDTSMTQYAILAMWEAEDLAEIDVPDDVWDQAASWLIRTQSLDGAHPYQGVPAATLDDRTKQDGTKDSMTLAAIGSLYIVKERLGLSRLRRKLGDNVPAALVPYETPDERAARVKTKIDPRYFTRSIGSGNTWISRNYDMEKPKGWLHYSLYALERYESLKEFDVRVGPPIKSPQWYQQGARFLIRTQKEDGSWASQGKEMVDTCFATLFLLRSMQKSLEKSGLKKFQGGRMAGGVGLPDAANVRVRNGAVVVEPLAAPLAEVLRLVRDPQHPSYSAAREALADLAHTADPAELIKQSQHLADLAASGPTEVRILAIEAIARSRNLELAPLLIQLLGDANAQVMLAAESGLQDLSRRYTAARLGAKPSDAERQKIQSDWKRWLEAVRPEIDVEVAKAKS